MQTLFNHLNRDPPSGYARCTISQLLAADKAAWTHLIEVNTKPRPDAAGVLALDKGLIEALKSYEVSFTLLPVVAKQPAKTPSSVVPGAQSNPQPHSLWENWTKGQQPFQTLWFKGQGRPRQSMTKRFRRRFVKLEALLQSPQASRFVLIFL